MKNLIIAMLEIIQIAAAMAVISVVLFAILQASSPPAPTQSFIDD
jgi:hypothetical protein